MTESRAVLDPNVLIAALLSPQGACAALVTRWLGGDFELVVSAKLLAELSRALRYPKLRSRIADADAQALVELLRRTATVVEDPAEAPRRSRNPGDDYLLALAEAIAAVLVSGDRDVLALTDLQIASPADFLARLGPGS